MKLSTLFLLCTGAASVAFGELPDAFLEYVESDGNAYVDTELKLDPTKSRAVIVLAPTVVNGTEKAVFGERSSSSGAGTDAMYVLLNGSKFRVDWIKATTATFVPTVNTIYRFD